MPEAGYEVCALDRVSQNELERGYQMFLDGRPMIACRTPMERLGWRDAQEDNRLESKWIIVPR